MKYDFNYWILGFKKNLRFLEMDFKIEFFLRETRSFFQFLKVSRVVKERFLCVRRIRLQFLNCPAFELWKIYGQGNGLSVSRPEITQFLTSWETRLPGKLSLFNVSFFHRDVGKTWTFDSLGLIYLSLFFFFFSYKLTENCHGFIIYRVIIHTMHNFAAKTKSRKPSGGSKICNDVEFTRENEWYNLWYLFGTRWADTANWMQFYENCQNIGKFCVIVTVYCRSWMLEKER